MKSKANGRAPGAVSRAGALPRTPWPALLFGALAALLTAAFNLTCGPLRNLNDIGSWHNRLLFGAMAGLVHLSLLSLTALLCRRGAARAMLRQLLVTAGFLILLCGINQKTYAYTQTVQPLVRAMDGAGLAAAAGARTTLSAPALTLLYLLTRGPVYDMYLLKLFAIACDLLLALFAARAAEELGEGLRAEAALLLCVILPQGFLSAGCAAEFEHAAALALALSLALVAGYGGVRRRLMPGMALYGVAIGLSGAALLALPLYALLAKEGRLPRRGLALSAALALALCLPAALCGMGPGAAASLVRAPLCQPPFASGAISLADFFPRAAVEEMPGYFILGRIPNLDVAAGTQGYYTEAHMRVAMRSVTLLGFALALAVWARGLRLGRAHPLRAALALTLGMLLACPGATSSAFLAADMLCVLAGLYDPGARVPAFLTLFATMCACAWPVTGEGMLPMIVALALCLLAVALLLGLFERPDGEGEAHG